MAAISEEEKLCRRQSHQSVLGSLSMEGLSLDPASAELGRRFDEGEITLDEFSSSMHAHVEAMALAAQKTQAESKVQVGAA